ncbi:MAG: hypothetical protein IPM42_04320 [Saprospiraceae bacterium]|nr:hypothetical protein [Saprospiraceae bacterium]
MINNWLYPVQEVLQKNSNPFFNVSFNLDKEEMPFLQNIKLAILGSNHEWCDSIRKELSHFFNHFENISIADIGNLKNNDIQFGMQLYKELIDSKIIPVIIGVDIQVAEALSSHFDLNLQIISNDIPEIKSDNLTKYNFIGYQRHMISKPAMNSVDANCSNAMSLGKMRSNINLLEPILRETEIAYFNINAIRSSEAPYSSNSYPSGLTTEELCQIMRYTGTSGQLKAVIFDVGGLQHVDRQEAKLMAEALWYLLEGLHTQTTDHPEVSKDCNEFIVSIPDYDTDITFVKNSITNKWWLKLESNDSKPTYVACAFEEYQQAISDEIPDRLLKLIL